MPGIPGGGVAGGVAGGAVAIVSTAAAAAEKMAMVVNRIATKAGEIGTPLAAGRNLEAVNRAATLAASGLERIPVVGKAAAESLKAVQAVGTAVADVATAVSNRGRELSAYDGRLAGATAQADVRRLQDDIREAQALGEKMSKVIEQQADMEATFREILLPIKEVFLDVLIEIMKALKEGVIGMLEALHSLTGLGGEILEKLKKKPDTDLLINRFFAAADNLLPDPPRQNPFDDQEDDATISMPPILNL